MLQYCVLYRLVGVCSKLMITYLLLLALGAVLSAVVGGFTSSSSSFHTTHNKLVEIDDTIQSRWGKAPYVALLTEPDACSSLIKVEDTIQAIDNATVDGNINLVVVRVNDNDIQGSEASVLKWALLKRLADMKKTRQFLLVVNDDVDIVLKALSENIPVDGVHVKEYKSHLIPSIRSRLEHASICSFDTTSHHLNDVIIGTSCHSIESGRKSYELSPRGPDYLFVGTCYLTQSHPEKDSTDQLEGPTLPGKVKEDLYHLYNSTNDNDGDNDDTKKTLLPLPPIIFAIGGIDQHNCHEPVISYGADGVATIRTVMQASNPSEVVQCMKSAMTR